MLSSISPFSSIPLEAYENVSILKKRIWKKVIISYIYLPLHLDKVSEEGDEDSLELFSHEAVDQEVGGGVQDQQPVHEARQNVIFYKVGILCHTYNLWIINLI